jgi:hypothetical protein
MTGGIRDTLCRTLAYVEEAEAILAPVGDGEAKNALLQL